MILVTGATGKLGQLVIQELLKRVEASDIVATVRDPSKATDLKALGVSVRTADYNRPESWSSALVGVQKILLISSNEIGHRFEQHRTVVEAGKRAGVSLFAYTSLLRAETSTLGLAGEHKDTEELIRASGLPYVFLRNGWYLENHTEKLGSALQHGMIMGSAEKGRFSSAARSDYAAAAAVVLTEPGHENKIYELAGDHSFNLADLAIEVTRESGKEVKYLNMSATEYEKALLGFGLPAPFANLIADSDVGASRGALESSSKDLHNLIGRSTVKLQEAIHRALGK